MAVRDAGPAAFAARRSSAQAGHLRGETGLVDEHEPGGVEIQLAVEPVPAPLQDVGAVLLQCVRGLLWDGPPLLRGIR
jgi:hypothetical protein